MVEVGIVAFEIVGGGSDDESSVFGTFHDVSASVSYVLSVSLLSFSNSKDIVTSSEWFVPLGVFFREILRVSKPEGNLVFLDVFQKFRRKIESVDDGFARFSRCALVSTD